MLKFLADENFDGRVLRGLLRHLPELDLVTVQNLGLRGRPDPEILERAAEENRILLSYDRATMPAHVHARVSRGERMPGVVIIPFDLPIQTILEALLVLTQAGRPEDFGDQVTYLPLR